MTATMGARVRRGQGRLPSLDHGWRLRKLAEIAETYATEANVREHETFFPTGALRTVREEPVAKRFAGVPMVDLRWTSGARAIDPTVQARFERDTHNREARVRWVGAPSSGRPVMILVHGYLGGHPDWELRLLPVLQWRSWGFDVAVVSLPFHGPRRAPSDKVAPKFPSVDPAWNIETFRLAIIELRELVAIAKDRGAPSVGVFGMSLGGYTSALLATAEPTLSICVPMIPLASLADFSRAHKRFPGEPHEREELHAALDRAMAPVSPVHRRPVIDRERIVILSAEGDRITHPLHAHRLAEHTGAKHVTFAGGHLLQFGRRSALAAVEPIVRALVTR